MCPYDELRRYVQSCSFGSRCFPRLESSGNEWRYVYASYFVCPMLCETYVARLALSEKRAMTWQTLRARCVIGDRWWRVGDWIWSIGGGEDGDLHRGWLSRTRVRNSLLSMLEHPYSPLWFPGSRLACLQWCWHSHQKISTNISRKKAVITDVGAVVNSYGRWTRLIIASFTVIPPNTSYANLSGSLHWRSLRRGASSEAPSSLSLEACSSFI